MPTGVDLKTAETTARDTLGRIGLDVTRSSTSIRTNNGLTHITFYSKEALQQAPGPHVIMDATGTVVASIDPVSMAGALEITERAEANRWTERRQQSVAIRREGDNWVVRYHHADVDPATGQATYWVDGKTGSILGQSLSEGREPPPERASGVPIEGVLGIASRDALMAYGDLCRFNVALHREEARWKVNFSLSNIGLNGGAPSYEILAADGSIVAKTYYQ